MGELYLDFVGIDVTLHPAPTPLRLKVSFLVMEMRVSAFPRLEEVLPEARQPFQLLSLSLSLSLLLRFRKFEADDTTASKRHLRHGLPSPSCPGEGDWFCRFCWASG